jgi:ABC-type polar amino acid transport system ATPase subunit
VSAALEVRDLVKRFTAEGRPVLDGLSLTAGPGEVVVVAGPSGTGKSTLLRCIAGLQPFDAGTIRLGERRATAQTPAALLGAVGLVFQGFELFPHLSVRGNCLLALRVVRGEADAVAGERVDALLAQLGLAEQANAFPATLSGGQRQRVTIARALAMEPAALLWDEPTSALDPGLRTSVAALIRGVAASNISQLVVTHDLEVARAVGNRIYRFVEGRLAE